MKTRRFLGVLPFICLSLSTIMNAQSLPKTLVVVVKPNVNVRQSPNPSAPVVSKAQLGTVYELVSKQTGWYEVKEALSGKKAYVASSVVKLCPDSDYRYPKTTEGIVGLEGNAGYVHTTKKQNSEEIATYAFWTKEQVPNVVLISLSTSVADTSGRMRSYENYYKGKQMGWYIAITEETDYEGAVLNKLDEPILVFKEANGNSGIYIKGVYFKEAGNPFD